MSEAIDAPSVSKDLTVLLDSQGSRGFESHLLRQ
jgi:hypothetical protein